MKTAQEKFDELEAVKKMKLDNSELKRERDKFKTVTDSFDFTSIKTGKDLLKMTGDNATLWAAAFSQITKEKLDIDIPKEYCVQWFANAIEHSWQIRKWREEQQEIENKLEDQDFVETIGPK